MFGAFLNVEVLVDLVMRAQQQAASLQITGHQEGYGDHVFTQRDQENKIEGEGREKSKEEKEVEQNKEDGNEEENDDEVEDENKEKKITKTERGRGQRRGKDK